MKRECDPSKCPIPVCQLPEELSARQIKTIMTFMELGYKEIAFDFGKSTSWVWDKLNNERKNPTSLRRISLYVRKRFLESVQK